MANPRRIIGNSALALAMIAGLGCGEDPSGPADSTPAPGSRDSGITNQNGIASLTLGNSATEIRVVDASGQPRANVKVGATVGKNHVIVAASDRSGTVPGGFAVYPISQFTGSSSLVSANYPGVQPAIGTITLVLLALSLVGGLLELTTDPVHQQIAIDEGIVKTCTAGDWNDVIAVIGPAVDAGGSVILSHLGVGKTYINAISASSQLSTELLGKLDILDRDRLVFCHVLVGDENFSLQLVVISTVTSGGLLAQDNGLPSRLYFIEPAASGNDLPIGHIHTATTAPTITDMALWDKVASQQGTPTLSHPEVYAVSFDALFKLNRRTALAERVATLANGGINALTFSKSGDLYAMGQTGGLLQLNPSNGAVLRTINLSPSVSSSGDLLFLPDGRLLASVTGTSSSDRLAEINTTSGGVQILGQVGFAEVFGLSYFDNAVWGVTAKRQLIRINTQTGQGTLVRSLSFAANGATSRSPQVRSID